jgi:hypothetical protein
MPTTNPAAASVPAPVQRSREKLSAARAPNVSERIAGLARQVQADPASIGVLSTGEACAVALLLNRLDLLNDHKHPLDALERLGPQWEIAVRDLHRQARIV